MGNGRDGTRNLRMDSSIVLLENVGMFLVQTSSEDPVDAQSLCITVLGWGVLER